VFAEFLKKDEKLIKVKSFNKHKKDVLKNVGNQTVAIYFFYGNQWGPSLVTVTDMLQIIVFCVQQMKEMHTGLEQLKGE